jgi:hypothetical protein
MPKPEIIKIVFRMKIIKLKTNRKVWVVLFILTVACTSPGNKNTNQMEQENKDFEKGTYGYDAAFLKENDVETIELKDTESKACVLLAPGYQGRVMTSTSGGNEGQSFGWINHALIESGKVSPQFNPVGGEERFWLGPEGGPYSIYFDEGKEQVYGNWKVPPVIDTERFEVKEQSAESVTFTKSTALKNASGTEFNLDIERTVSLISADSLSSFFDVSFRGNAFSIVGYRSDNMIKNTGPNAWTKDGGLLSIWMLCMFSPSPSTTVFIPYNQEGEGTIVNDDYFGKVPPERLVVEDGVVYFKIDGAFRSKIGIPPQRAKELCGSYDSASKTLTLVWGTLPSEPKSYVNSKWGEQYDPYEGDVINSYNDGPVDDGTIMGPFYEIETSSPAAGLQPGESLTHSQVVVHVQGNEPDLARLVNELFGLDLNAISTKFQ